MITLHWHTEPGLLITLLVLVWGYAVATGPLRGWIAPGAPYPAWRAASYYAAVVVTYLTVGSPLDQIGEQFLFSMHMVQHELLIYVIPPLFILGTPPWLVDWVIEKTRLRAPLRILTKPVVAGVLFTFTFSIWHVPGLYEAALHDKGIHIFEHVTVFLTATLMLWPFLSQSRLVPTAAYGVQMIYVFLLMIGQLPIFAFLSFADEVFYPTYEYAARLEFMNVAPLADQILGGVIMKVWNMLVSITLFTVAWYRWASVASKVKGRPQTGRTLETATP